MGNKIHPKSIRLGIVEDWTSKWMSPRHYRHLLEEDDNIRSLVKDRLKAAGIDVVRIERSGQNIRVIIKTARPGLVIGRSGKGVDDLRRDIEKVISRIRKKHTLDATHTLNIDVDEIKRSDVSAAVTAQNIAGEIERRLKFRRIMKQTIEKTRQYKGVEGVKVRLSGRLDGSEIARKEWLASGKVPLHTLRARIDYGEATAFCSYGTVGIKVWIYKGEVFDKDHESTRAQEQ